MHILEFAGDQALWLIASSAEIIIIIFYIVIAFSYSSIPQPY